MLNISMLNIFSTVVVPEMVAKKRKATKDNKSPGMDEIPPKLLMESVEQRTSVEQVYHLQECSTCH